MLCVALITGNSSLVYFLSVARKWWAKSPVNLSANLAGAGFARVHPWILDMPEPEPSPVFPVSVLMLFGLASHGRDLQKYLLHKSHKLAFDKPCVTSSSSGK